MNKIYEKELIDLYEKMEKANKFAKRVPLFKDLILSDKITGEEPWIKFGSTYKEIYLAWGINRGFFKSGTNRYITNLKKNHAGYYFNIYINTCSLFDAHEKFNLYEKMSKCSTYFIDKSNSTFYIEDEHIYEFLETLNDWYIEAMAESTSCCKEKRIAELRDELAKLEEEKPQ